MVNFATLQEIIIDHLEDDRNVHYVETVGPTMEAAISDAAALLDVPVRNLEFEIIEKGSPGFMGFGKKDWRLQAYEHIVIHRKRSHENELDDLMESDAPAVEDKDGDVFIHLNSDGDALLKATAPSGRGRKASETYAMQFLNDRKVENIDTNLVNKAVKESSGEYVKVGEFDHHSYNDSVVRVEISESEMLAYMVVTAPGEGGCDISFDSYITALKDARVVHGIKEDFLLHFVDQPIYGQKIEIAEGTKPKDGKNAYIQYYFEIDQSRARLREGSNGRVNFKELNIIQNVVENQPLAKKIAPENGVAGETVTGKSILARDGVDISIPVGTNAHIDKDEETVLSDINGQVIFVNSLINVEPVLTIDGDVNLKTGNIIFLGTVIVKGNVEDGFSIKAAGNIEVHGTVSKSDLDAEGDIIIHQGINAKGEGNIHAGKSLWARFIQNANIETGNMVVASDGIINSKIDALNRIICQGKRAHIMGGRLRAREEINAKVLGNPTSGTETIFEVGFDPKSKEELDRLQELKINTEKQLEEIKLNMQTLINQKKQRKSLPEEKEVYLQELMDKRSTLMVDFKKAQEGIHKLQEYLGSLKLRGKISASSKVYPGVKIVIRDSRDEIRQEHRATTFILENGLIKPIKYEEPEEDARRGPDGYTTN
ncbi:MAG: FapA family protein [Treponema sp.]|nr:FapA family protein [Treponema sp.]